MTFIILFLALIKICILGILAKIICWAFGLVFNWKIVIGLWAILIAFNIFLGGSK